MMAVDLQELAQARLRELGINAFEAARRGGLERQFIHDIIKGKKRSVRSEHLPGLARALELTPEALGSAVGVETPTMPTRLRRGPTREVVPAQVALPNQMPRDIPVFAGSGSVGFAEQETFEGFQIDRSKAIDRVARMPGLADAADVYAVYVSGETMSPMHSPGEIRFVHPHRPVRAGDSVLIITRLSPNEPEIAWLKLFQGRTPTTVVARQLNPDSTVSFKTSTILAVHRVLTLNELVGA